MAKDTFFPELIVGDINNDGEDELTIILTEAEGTGLVIQKAHVFSLEEFMEYQVTDPLEIISNKAEASVNMSSGKVNITVSVNGDTQTTVLDEAYATNWVKDEVLFKNVVRYSVEGQKLTATVGAQVSDVAYAGDMVITYSYDGLKYDFGTIEYRPYEF